MGVSGLTPFLRRAYPTVIRNLPERFRGLRGKRLVIDGTLLTQRFHFVADKHPYQHIISWYRFAQELNQHGVSAVCIFDGKQRSRAKARETQRRRQVLDLAVARATIEQDRFARLTRVRKTLRSFEQLRDEDRRNVVNILTADPSFTADSSSALLQAHSFLEGGDSIAVPPIESLPAVLREEPPSIQVLDLTETVTPTSNALQVVSQFKSSFLGFKANAAKLLALSVEQPQVSPPDLPSSAQEDEHVEKVMSKSQYGLTVNESKFWKNCINTLSSDTPPMADRGVTESPRDQLESLVDRSSVMVSMYERRINVPTQETYKQARQILEALGIACIEATGAYEGEALAASMVIEGLADYVVSEDTDVLVYEAPLIRNMTTRDPFLMVCGSDVRNALQLTRDEYIDFAILLGTDFSQRITNVGPVRALNFIREYRCIENVVDSIENHPKYQLKLPKAAYLAQVDIARSVFKTLPSPPSSAYFESIARSDGEAERILKRHGILQQNIYPDWPAWRHEDALVGNYFDDTPFAG